MSYALIGNLLSSTKNTYNTYHLLSTTHPNGTITCYKYDGAGRLIAESTEDKLITYKYDTQSRRSATLHHIDGDARISRIVYDLKGQVIEERTENLAGEIFTKVSYLYDAESRKTRSTTYGAHGVTCSVTEYDPYGRVTCVTDHEGHSVITTYDEFFVDEQGCKGCLFTQIDPLGIRTLTLHDALGRVVKIEKQGITGNTLSLSRRFYDLAGNLAEERHTIITPGKTNRLFINLWEYDSFGKPLLQLEAYKSEEQKTTYYSYDSAGHLAATTLPSGIVISQMYDALGRLMERYSSSGDLSQHFSYDIAGNPILIESHEGTIERTYDSQNRMTKEKLMHGHTLCYIYDALDRVTQIVLPDLTTIDYIYDPMHLKAIIRGDKTHTYDAYDLHGNLITATLATGEKATYSYNSLGRLESIDTPRWSEGDITYDPLGNITSFIIDNLPCNYAYDELSQLKEERGLSEHSYQHDSLSNRTCKDGSTYGLNALNQVIFDGHQNYVYDVNGNLIKGDGLSYTYDSLGRVTMITNEQDSSYNYTYDPFNRRIASNEIDFIYQGEMEIGAIRDGEIVELRVLGKGRGAEIGATVLIEIEGESFTPLHDHNGHCAVLLSDDKVIEKYRYSAFGEEEKQDYINPWRFSSKRHDATGLINFGRRYYHPKLGRWITPDPKGFSEGPNLYAYCANNPLVKFDLYGLFLLRFMEPNYSASQENYMCYKRESSFNLMRRGIGRGIEKTCHHLNPHPEGYNAASILGRLIAGDGFQRYSAGYIPVRMDVINKGGCPGKEPLILIPGIGNTHEDGMNKIGTISKTFGDRETYLVNSPCEGTVTNLLRAASLWLSHSSKESEMVNKFVRGQLKNNPNHPGFDIYGESRGSMHVGLSQKTMHLDDRERVKMYTMGGKILYPDGFGIVESHIAERDPVPIFCDPIAYRWARTAKPDHVKFHKSDHWMVHDFDDPDKPYQQVYQENARFFRGRFQ